MIRASKILVAASLLVLTGLVVGWQLGSRTPAASEPGSADVVFAQEMSQHHAQAVLMSMIMLEVAEPGEVRSLAQSIALSQQLEIGIMQGWLLSWNRDTRPDGHSGHDMAGMASDADVQSLRTLSQAEAKALYLRLMRAHHIAGIAMAEQAQTNGRLATTTTFASSLQRNQELEIAYIDAMPAG